MGAYVVIQKCSVVHLVVTPGTNVPHFLPVIIDSTLAMKRFHVPFYAIYAVGTVATKCTLIHWLGCHTWASCHTFILLLLLLLVLMLVLVVIRNLLRNQVITFGTITLYTRKDFPAIDTVIQTMFPPVRFHRVKTVCTIVTNWTLISGLSMHYL